MKTQKPRNYRAETELLGALWAVDPRACAHALSEGANPNARQWDDDEHTPMWSALLRISANPHRQVECLRMLINAGLTLNGGGPTSRHQTMLMRIETLDVMVADALIEEFGERRLRKRLASQGARETLDEKFWNERLSAFLARRQLEALEQTTAPAPNSRPRPRL